MSARRLSVERRGPQVRLCIEGIEHRLSEPAFVELMSKGLRVLQALQDADRLNPTTTTTRTP